MNQTEFYCPKCYYGVQKPDIAAYLFISNGHPVVIPDVLILRCDLCGHSEPNDALFNELITEHLNANNLKRHLKKTQEISAERVDKKRN